MRRIAKVPVHMQMEAAECGAVCLGMILGYYGKWVTPEELRKNCGISRDGSNAKNIILAGRLYGLRGKGMKCTAERLRQLPMPLIIHWDMNHFVVLCGFKKDRAVLCDPAHGRVQVPMERFERSFTGIALSLTPDEQFEKGGKPRSMGAFLLPNLRGNGAMLALIILLSALVTVPGLLSPLLSRVFVDRILQNEPQWLGAFLGILLGILCFQLLVSLLQSVWLLRIRGKLAVTASAHFMWHSLRLPVEFFHQRYAGDLLRRQESHEKIAETLLTILGPTAINIVMMVLYMVVMLRYSPRLALIGFCAVAVNLACTQLLSHKLSNLSREALRDQEQLGTATLSGIELIETIKAAGAEQSFFENWSGLDARLNCSEEAGVRVKTSLGILPGLVTQLADILVLLSGAYLILGGQLTAGILLAVTGVLSGLFTPVSALLELGPQLQDMKISMERVEDVLENPVDVSSETQKEDEDASKLRGCIELKHLTFGYSRVAEPILKDFSLTIQPRETIAVVGASGCGKSTLTKLISGLYEPWSGEILYDGKPRSEIPHAVFTSSLAVVEQDIALFEDSIFENIRLWDKSVEDFEVIMAARDAQIHGDIVDREGGYQAKLRENGKNFSGGQCQRMEIARVLSQDPSVLILDEATAALDAQTEYQVMEAIRARGITCIVIAHRLSTIRDCDRILVLEEGELVEQGTHQELYAKNGRYTRLVSME